MRVSKRARRHARTLFRHCLVDGALDEGRVRDIVRRLVREKPREFVQILAHFHRLVKLDIHQRTGNIESAQGLPEDLQERFRATLVERYGPRLTLSFRENRELIGGVRAVIGYDVYDASVRGRLRALAEQF